MFTRIRNKAVLTLGFVLLVLVVNCSVPQEVKTPPSDTELAAGKERTSSITKVPSTQEPTSQSKGQPGGTEPPPAAAEIPATQTQQSPTLTPEIKTGDPAPDAQTPDTKAVAKKETKPSAEKKPSRQEPTSLSIPQPSATDPPPATKELPGTQIQQSSSLTPEIKISEVGSDLPDYDRGDWKHWIDDDRDCQNARHEVLIEESLIEVTFKSPKQCQVATGKWLDPYTGDTITDATKLDVDHMVPLKNAHDSGGWAWDKDKKAAYANEMGYADHLIAVTASANRKKSARGPEGWKPTNEGYWCDYAIDWVQIKFDWGLSATKAEWAALQEMLVTCDNPPSYTPVPSKPKPVATLVPPATTPATDSADIQIASIDCKSKPEILVIKNNGRSPQNLTGWKVQDDGPKYTFDFPKGFSLQPKSLVDLISGASGDNTATTIYWSGRTVWNNDGDTARLFDSTGELVSEMRCFGEVKSERALSSGTYHHELGQYERAIEDFDEEIRLDPDDPIFYGHRGAAYYELGKYQRAIEDFDEGIRLDPLETAFYHNRGSAYNALGQYERAIEDLNNAIRLDPENPKSHGNRGSAYNALGQYERAIEDFDEEIRLDPDDPITYNNRASAYNALGQYQRAIKDMDKAIRLDPLEAALYSNRGFVYSKLGKYELFIKDFDEAIRLDPHDAETYYTRGEAYEYLGDGASADRDFQKARELGFPP